MSVEAPIQIDLSQDNSWNSIDDSLLTLEDKALLQEHFTEESEGIIYLTQQELAELKDVIGIENSVTQNPRGSTDSAYSSGDAINEFFSEQREEGLSLSDIMGSDFEHSEDVDALDEYTKDILFGNEGILSSLDLSDTAKDHFSLALSLSLIERLASGKTDIASLIATGASLNPEDQQGALRTLFGDIIPSLEGLQTLAEEEVGPGREFRRLNISGNGETNSILMNPEEGKDFFNTLLDGGMDEESIESTLEGANNAEDIGDIDFSNIKIETTEDISALASRLEDLRNSGDETATVAAREAAAAIAQGTEGDSIDEESPERKGLIAKLFEAIMKFLTGLTEGLDEVLGNEENNENSTDPVDNPEEIAPTALEAGRNLFRTSISEGNISPFTLAQIQDLFPEEGELSETARNIIESISNIAGEENLETEFNNLFALREGKENTKFEEFIIASNSTIIVDGKLPEENILSVLEKYNEYRAGGTRELYTVYFDSDANTQSEQN